MKEKISIKNYEAFWLDHLEGNLSAKEEKCLQDFLDKYPLLKKNLSEVKPLTITENINYTNKESLKREIIPLGAINKNNYEEYFSLAIDNVNLNEVIPFLKLNPFLAKEFDYYKKTQIKADTSIQYKNKKRLKKTAVFTLNKSKMQWAVAASIFFAISTFWFWNTNKEVEIMPTKMALKNISQLEIIKNEIELEKETPNNFQIPTANHQKTEETFASLPINQNTKTLEKIPTLNNIALCKAVGMSEIVLLNKKEELVLPDMPIYLAAAELEVDVLWWQKIGKIILKNGSKKIEDFSNGNLAFQLESNKTNTKKELSLKMGGFELNHTFAKR